MSIIWGVVALLLAFWVAGLILHIGGGLIHLLLVVALVLLLFNVFTGRGARV
jgi:hypothetical protein